MNRNFFSEDEFLSSYITDQTQNPTSSNTSTGEPNILTPEDILPFPKISVPKKRQSQGRKKKKGISKILTHQLKDRLKKNTRLSAE